MKKSTLNNIKYYQNEYANFWHKEVKKNRKIEHHVNYQKVTLELIEVKKNDLILECGCGTGELIERLANSTVNNFRIFGIDISISSLIISKKSKIKGNVICGDIESLPFPDNIFDKVLASSVMWYLRNQYVGIKEMLRVLKPGGSLVFDIVNLFHITNLLSICYYWIRKIIYRLLGRYLGTFSVINPLRLNGFIKKNNPISLNIKGYYLFIPTSLPVLGDLLNIFIYFPNNIFFYSSSNKLNVFGQKIIYKIRK